MALTYLLYRHSAYVCLVLLPLQSLIRYHIGLAEHWHAYMHPHATQMRKTLAQRLNGRNCLLKLQRAIKYTYVVNKSTVSQQ